MSEGVPSIDAHKAERAMKRKRMIELALELSQGEVFPFPGLDPEAYEKLQAGIEADKDRSDYDISTPTLDELIARFKQEGIKVSLGKNPIAGNIFILPSGSDDIQSDSLPPKHLQITKEMDQKLEALIILAKSM